jgi:hypothetical protein
MFDARTLRLSLAVFAVAACAAVWEVLAEQAPGSALYLGMMPSPIRALRAAAFGLGVSLFLAAQLLPRAFPERTPPGVWFSLLAGALAVVCSALYGAAMGLHGEQLRDLRPDALPLFLIKHAGYLALLVAFARIGLRAVAPSRPT